ncbi:MAG: RNA-binding protein [Clostridia bacterium]|nr:RNA-binding protein [Clostridia bacterium]MBQ9847585.1 RNA-binding protein [Clostridia bacterium]
MNDLLGQLVVSLAGRDKGCICAIIGNADEEGFVYIADGRLRKVENPKKKKLKHLKPIDRPDRESVRLPSERLTNRFIREAVNALNETESEPI